MEHCVIKVNRWKLLTIMTKSSILDVAAVLDPSLVPMRVFSYSIYAAQSWFLDPTPASLHAYQRYISLSPRRCT